MTYEGAKKLLSENGQEHVLRFWDRLNDAEKASLLAQVEELDFSSIAKQKEILAANLAGTASAAGEQAPMEPAPVTVLSDSDRADIAKIGEHELKAGHVGVLLVAVFAWYFAQQRNGAVVFNIVAAVNHGVERVNPEYQ